MPTTLELWHQHTGHAGSSVLEALPTCCDGVPANLIRCKHGLYKCICCQTSKSTKTTGNDIEDVKAQVPGERFHMDFGFIKAKDIAVDKNDTGEPTKLVTSYDGYNSYLIIVDKATRYIWVFLSANKAPPLKTLHQFLTKHGIPESKREGLNMAIRTDQGGELAGSEKFNKIADSHGYSIKRTAAGSLS